MIFDRAVLSARLFESQTVRDDAETVFDSAVRVPVPNARLNLCRRPQTCLRMFQLHEHRPREENVIFWLVISESVQAREDTATVFDTETRVPSIPAKRSHIKN